MLITNTVFINAPAKKVWDALTNPAQTKQYMYGCEALSPDWQPGSELLWQGEYEGKKMVFVKGSILTNEPEKLLCYTTIDPNGKYEDKPENYLTVRYELHEADGHTALTVTQGDYTKVPDGEKRHADAASAGGWSAILEQVKALAETAA